ncbi:MAG: family 20 glycosylhydrolase [Fidelibacterota bacterium]|nr:MAG: family 20 glycosylhydrolase [Candidatus Neomarinimicrobiota bacterium]
MKSLYTFLLIMLIYPLEGREDQTGQMASQQLNLMPMPAELTPGEGRFPLGEDFTIRVSGPASDRAYGGATRMLRRLSGRTGLFFSQDFIGPEDTSSSAPLELKWSRVGQVELGENESYTLAVAADHITLSAETDIGILRGLETLLQLLVAGREGYHFPAFRIEDTPRFAWRGLLIDVCRHFMPVDVIKRNLDGMAAVKLNVLHWHLSENQGFRVESKTYPKLHQLGSDGFYYTQEQIKDVLAYADARGIRVMPEFDMPGHATSWLVGYPELGSAPGPYTIERKFGIFDPTMDPTRETTYTFLDAFFKEMSDLFPDRYMHIGGDEVEGSQWEANADIHAFMRKHQLSDNEALQSYFNQRILKILTKYDRKLIGWDEIFHPSMPTNIVIHSWRGQKALGEAASQGYQGILSNGYYIDLIQPTDFHYLNDPIPPGSELTSEAQANILGGEATMWAEFITPETIDSRIWPRLAAIAERLWSPIDVRDVGDMYRRLDVISFQLEELGLMHEKNYPMMLRRLTNNTDIEPLKVLVDVIEPVKYYNRPMQREYTSYSPMTRTVDAARPDAKVARNFRRLVDEYLNERKERPATGRRFLGFGRKGRSEHADEMITWLELWQANHARLKVTIDQSPVLDEIETLSADLASCATIGLEALKYLEEGKKASPRWVEGKRNVIKAARKPRGQAELMVTPAIDALVQAAGGVLPE